MPARRRKTPAPAEARAVTVEEAVADLDQMKSAPARRRGDTQRETCQEVDTSLYLIPWTIHNSPMGQLVVRVLSTEDRYRQGTDEGYPLLVVNPSTDDPGLLAGITLDQFEVSRDAEDSLPPGVSRVVWEDVTDLEPISMAKARQMYAQTTAEVIRDGLEMFAERTLPKLIMAYEQEHWRILGHGDWDTYLAKEFGEQLLILQGNVEVMKALRGEASMPTRAIAAVVRKSHETVRQVLKAQDPGGGGTVKDSRGRRQPASKPRAVKPAAARTADRPARALQETSKPAETSSAARVDKDMEIAWPLTYVYRQMVRDSKPAVTALDLARDYEHFNQADLDRLGSKGYTELQANAYMIQHVLGSLEAQGLATRAEDQYTIKIEGIFALMDDAVLKRRAVHIIEKKVTAETPSAMRVAASGPLPRAQQEDEPWDARDIYLWSKEQVTIAAGEMAESLTEILIKDGMTSKQTRPEIIRGSLEDGIEADFIVDGMLIGRLNLTPTWPVS